MKKTIYIIITYFCILSIVNADELFKLSFAAESLPYTSAAHPEYFLLGFNGGINLLWVFSNVGFSSSIHNYYHSLNTINNNYPFAGINNLRATTNFVYSPASHSFFETGLLFDWQRSAFTFDERGSLAQNAFGLGFTLNYLFDPIAISEQYARYFGLNINNSFIFSYTHENLSDVFHYHGAFTMLFYPYIRYVAGYLSLGVSTLQHNSEAGSLTTAYFNWGLGIIIQYEKRKTNNIKTQEKIEPPKEMPPEEIKEQVVEKPKEEIKKETTTVPQVTYSAFYRSLSDIPLNQSMRIYNVFFSQKRISGAGKSKLDDVILYCINNPKAIILITGYAEDNIQSDSQIISIAAERASIIRDYCIARGIKADRIKRSTSALTYDITKQREPYIEIRFLQK